jgi:hypothetical protein
MLVNGVDYAATTGSSITGLAALSAGDVLTVVALGTVTVESGTWTPVLVGTTTAGAQSYATQSGFYRRHGDIVTVWCAIALSSLDAATNGNIRINGLPFTSVAGAINYACVVGTMSDYSLSTGFTAMHLEVLQGASQIRIRRVGPTGQDNLLVTEISGTFKIQFSCSYPVA